MLDTDLDADATPPAGTDIEPVLGPVEPPASPSWWQRQEPWSVAALALAVVGVVPATWEVPIISLLAVAFALVGWRRHQLDETLPNRWMPVVALFLGLATLAVVMIATALGKVNFLPFWTAPA